MPLRRAYDIVYNGTSGLRGMAPPGSNLGMYRRTRNTWRKRSRGYGGSRMVNLIQKVIKSNSELKFNEQGSASFVTVTGTLVVPLLDAIAEGTDSSDRIGRKIQLRSCSSHICLESAPSAQPFSAWLVLDRQPNGTSPTFADMFTSVSAVPSLAHKNILNNEDRFKILWHCAFPDANNATVSANDTAIQHFEKFVNFEKRLSQADRTTEYETVVAGTPVTNGLYFVFAMNSALATGTVAYDNRIRFTDS